MNPETRQRNSPKPLLRLIVTVAILLTLLHVVMFAVWHPAPVIVPFPWVIPMLTAIMIVIASSVSFLALVRFCVLRDLVSFWTGLGFAAFSVGFVFYLLAWPGLLPNGEPIIGHFPSTSAWVSLPVMSLLAVCLLAASLSSWPGTAALSGRRWIGAISAWLFLVILGGMLTAIFEKSLPVLVETDGTYTPLAMAWIFGVLFLLAWGAVLSARHYLQIGDTLPGYVSFTQMFIAFALLMADFGMNRFGLTFYLDRFVVIGGFLVMQFGLLSEYVRLFRCERERIQELELAAVAQQESQDRLKTANAELEQRVAERTSHLEEHRVELERRNQQLQETYLKLKEQTDETIRALKEVQERDRLLIQQNRLAALGELIMNIAHQWRQPLNVLALMIQEQAMQHRQGSVSREELDANTKKAMEVIGNMSRTIDDFRNFFIPGKEGASFRVNDLLSKLIAMVGASFRGLQLSIDLRDQLDLVVYGHQDEFTQVLLNILMNARDAFWEHAVPEPRIVIRMFREGGRGVVTIADNAGGIPEEVIDRVFDPYFTTKEPGKGTGIGLYMAKTIIEKHMHGSLTVRNAGGGAEFRIEISD